MMKLNNKGFVLAEMLIVTVFLMIIFSMLYANFYPILAEYEIREGYDDVDSKYAVYWLKKVIEDKDYNFNKANINNTNTYIEFSCNEINSAEKKATCETLKKDLKVDTVYITNYQIDTFKSTVNDSDSFSAEFQSYLNTLPDYTRPSLNNAKYRVIAIFTHHVIENDPTSEEYKTYSTIEVRR